MIPRVRGPISCFTVLAVAFCAGAQTPLKFLGRDVTVTNPGTEDEYGMFPKGPATVCLEGTPRQCFTMPGKFGRKAHVEVVEVKTGTPALFFSAENGGVSGWAVQFALLRPGKGKDLDDFLALDSPVSNLSQHVFWTAPEISDAKIFATADYEWGPDEGHYGPHRYFISAYGVAPPPSDAAGFYYLSDRYLTARKYDSQKDDILAAEKQEILARLLRVKQQSSSVR